MVEEGMGMITRGGNRPEGGGVGLGNTGRAMKDTRRLGEEEDEDMWRRHTYGQKRRSNQKANSAQRQKERGNYIGWKGKLLFRRKRQFNYYKIKVREYQTA